MITPSPIPSEIVFTSVIKFDVCNNRETEVEQISLSTIRDERMETQKLIGVSLISLGSRKDRE